jgi:uncharacterized protein (DUF2237 family)
MDATEEGVACPISLECTHEEALAIIPIDVLEAHGE